VSPRTTHGKWNDRRVRDPRGVPLTLVTGPANAEKARVVLDGYRQAADRAPLLVVPTFADVVRYRDELAADGLVFGTAIVRFRHLAGEMARRAGVRGRSLTYLQRDRVAAAAIASVPLHLLRRSARTPGFAHALVRLAGELEQGRVDPPRFTQALRAWAADGSRAAYAEELAALYAAYRGALERMGRMDDDLRLAAAVDGLRADPDRWGGRPVFVYGFDDLRPLQREAIAVLASAADVTVSLTFEAGRYAFAGRTETVEALRPLAGRVVELPATADHYGAPALHHLERRLFEPPEDGALFDAAAPDPADAITLMQGGGERAELELVAAEVARMIRADGVPPEEIAVVARDVQAVAHQLRRVFATAGVPVALERRAIFGHTPLGAGLVALLRCALLDGTAEDLLTWLRTPGLLREPAFADRLEAYARQEGARTAAAARELWEREHWPLDAIDRIAAAHERGPRQLMEALSAELAARFAAPYARQAAILDGAQAADARVLAAGRRALGDLADLAAAGPALAPQPADLARLLAELEVGLRDEPRAGAVAVSEPLALRARRVRALVLCGMQENRFPAPARPEPFLGDAERRELAAASGLVLRRHEDTIDAERYLLYATVSRPEERLVLSWHDAGDDGDPAVRSLFVDDIASLFGPALWERRRRRGLGEVGWAQAPSEPERRRGEAVAGPRMREAPPAPLRHPEVLAAIRSRRSWSVSDVEAWAGCPVKWLVERRLRLQALEPDDEHLLRGSAAHAALERALRRLVRENGSTALSPDRLPAAREAVAEALEGLAGRIRLSTDPRRVRALARRLEVDLLRYVEHAAHAGSAHVPAHFEVSFGGDGDELGPLRLSADVAVAGRIDRIDVRGRSAVVYDYKGRTTTDGAHWVAERKWQVALYLIAVKELLDLEPAGGLYQPLGSKDLRPRGALLADADPGLDAVRNDRREPDDLEALVDSVVSEVLRAVAELRSGALQPRPATCAYGGGCSYPMICRAEA
jgi:ATP-dependent helicase/DNAse subunit B